VAGGFLWGYYLVEMGEIMVVTEAWFYESGYSCKDMECELLATCGGVVSNKFAQRQLNGGGKTFKFDNL
jgi:hypothetical protein